ncbi:hypothetical protein BN3589_03904 [Clostridium sp. C105KSO14]|nr:hypothetical protein BN3589_03904 [Clostridium sp. C105KSO14]
MEPQSVVKMQKTGQKHFLVSQKRWQSSGQEILTKLIFSGNTGGRKNNMQKVIEKAVIKITQEMERNRKAYNEARGSYNDTGYDRYYNKMTKLDAEYEELKAFLHPEEKSEVPEVYRECDELRQMLRNLKNKWQYLRADLPVSADTIGIDDLLRDVR